MRLINRGYAISNEEYPNGAFIEFEWKWRHGNGIYSDHLTVVFRTDGRHLEKWAHEVQYGFAVKFIPQTNEISIWDRRLMTSYKTPIARYENARISRDYWHTIRIVDKDQQLSVYFNDLSKPVLSTNLPDDLKHHRIAIYNREAVGGEDKESLLINIALGVPEK